MPLTKIYTLEFIDKTKPSIFLAGPTYRSSDERDEEYQWRKDAIDKFENIGYSGTVIIPEYRNNIEPKGLTYEKQIQWERYALSITDVIVFWIPRNMKKLPALTTNIEFGEWLHSGKIVIGAPDTAEKNDYLKSRCNFLGIPWYNDMLSLICASIDLLNSQQRSSILYTSDTHFSQKRTLELSKRPFKNTREMDHVLIKNWNAKVAHDSIVYHLGDFGDPNILPYLKGKEIRLLPGNYERDDYKEDGYKQFLTDPRVKIIEPKHKILIKGIEFTLIHEPCSISTEEYNIYSFYLFGHIHNTQKIKRNGLNVGTDCFNFSPIDEEMIMFQYNGILNHYDENVFIDEIGSVDCEQT
jgi:calcineurin-like phosphoesterase family protein